MRGRWSLADVRAGYVDARRTSRSAPLAGMRIGAADYAAGYLVGAVVARWER